jgi:hypothetical protein
MGFRAKRTNEEMALTSWCRPSVCHDGRNWKAKAAYEDLQLWKEADKDLPIGKQARAEYAKLQ